MKSIRPKRVLFVCVGNSCRSQMAEGFARCYGKDVMKSASAGLAPAWIVMPETVHTMAEKNIDISDQYPKPLHPDLVSKSDLIVNMSGEDLPEEIRTPVRNWQVRDPIGEPETIYREVRDQIEQLVMDLILEIRRAHKKSESAPHT